MIVFTITNDVTDEVYVGTTKDSVDERWKQYQEAAKLDHTAARLFKDIRDFGAEKFTISEFAVAYDREDLKERLGKIFVGYTFDNKPIYAKDLKAEGAMAVLLKDAIKPNLVQTMEGNPAIIHGGPFANIAQGTNSIIATKMGLSLSNYVVTEAGFGADLGAEKFLDIKCRKSGLEPAAIVLVATVRALKMHGGVAKNELAGENVEAVVHGCSNLERHISNLSKFGVPVTVAINCFVTDTEAELQAIRDRCAALGVSAFDCTHWSNGGAGTEALAQHVAQLADSDEGDFKLLYDDEMPLWDKAQHIAKTLYGADEIIADKKVREQFARFQEQGYGHFPVCMAKTQYSFSTDPNLMGAPSGHAVPVREVRLSAGAEFIVVVCGDIMTMPGLPRVPSADHIHINEQGQIDGLF